MDWLLKMWEGLPWWVGVLILVLLMFYALVRAGYELWKEEETARKKAEDKVVELKETLRKTTQQTPISGPRLTFKGGGADNAGTMFRDGTGKLQVDMDVFDIKNTGDFYRSMHPNPDLTSPPVTPGAAKNTWKMPKSLRRKQLRSFKNKTSSGK
jgi:hypothetical protein